MIGEPVANTEQPLSVELGPGLLASIYDGVQRPLPVLMQKSGDFIARGIYAPGLTGIKSGSLFLRLKKVITSFPVISSGLFRSSISSTVSSSRLVSQAR